MASYRRSSGCSSRRIAVAVQAEHMVSLGASLLGITWRRVVGIAHVPT